MICGVYSTHQAGEDVFDEYLKGCKEVAEYLVWSPDCCPDHCAGHPLCDPCARRSFADESFDGEYIARIESLASQ